MGIEEKKFLGHLIFFENMVLTRFVGVTPRENFIGLGRLFSDMFKSFFRFFSIGSILTS